MNPHSYYSQQEVAAEQARFMTKVYGWMSFALVLTGLMAFFVASNSALQSIIFGNPVVFFGLIIGELGLVWYLSSRINSMSASAATGWFVFYALLNGLTLASIFMTYSLGSIASTFFITAGTFAATSAFGYFTKRDLTGMGSMLMMALIGLIIASVVNIFLGSSTLTWVISYAGVLIFVGLTAYDTQKIKEMNIIGNEGTEEDHKEAIMGSLTLYLDFINLFLFLLRILGSRD